MTIEECAQFVNIEHSSPVKKTLIAFGYILEVYVPSLVDYLYVESSFPTGSLVKQRLPGQRVFAAPCFGSDATTENSLISLAGKLNDEPVLRKAKGIALYRLSNTVSSDIEELDFIQRMH